MAALRRALRVERRGKLSPLAAFLVRSTSKFSGSSGEWQQGARIFVEQTCHVRSVPYILAVGRARLLWSSAAKFEPMLTRIHLN